MGKTTWAVAAVLATVLSFGDATAANATTSSFDAMLTVDNDTTRTIGWSSALSGDGRRAVLGAPVADGYNGAVYVYDKAGAVWSAPTVLQVPGTSYQEIGYSVDITSDGRTIVAGAPFFNGSRVYVFSLTRTGWQLTATLTTPGLRVDNLGSSVSISDDGRTVAAGDEFRSSRRGSVFVWTRSDSGWSAATEVIPAESDTADLVGSSVSISGDGRQLAIGAKGTDGYVGAVYTFALRGTRWAETARLTEDGGRFGNAVALSGNGKVLIADAPYHGHGVAYAFTSRDGGWGDGQLLQPSQKSDYPSDAISVAASYDGSTLSLGLPARNTLQGAAEIFRRGWNGYVPVAMQVPSEYAGWMVLAGAGTSVALDADGSTSLIGAPDVSGNYPAGAGYLYELDRPGGYLRSPGRPRFTNSQHSPDAHGPVDLNASHRIAKPILDGTHKTAAVCGDAATDKNVCGAKIVTDSSMKPLVTASYEDGLTATQLQTAYTLRGGSARTTVAVVDAYANPDAAESLNTYRAQFGLGPADFTQVNQDGGAALPDGDANWGVEELLDLEMVSAACPDCRILYVGADSASLDDLGTSVNTAVRLGAKVVSNSYGGDENEGDLVAQRKYFDHPGVAITVSSGDSGYGMSFPAAFNTVIAVGGTSLTLNSDGTRGSESAWEYAGSGCSRFVAKPWWQKDTYCQHRTVADVSAVADPETGVAVYDAYGLKGWAVVGGTSVSAPIIAGIYGRTGHTAGYPAQRLYSAPKGSLYDVTSGANGTCSSLYLCTGRNGYDGPSGLGAPNGVGAF